MNTIPRDSYLQTNHSLITPAPERVACNTSALNSIRVADPAFDKTLQSIQHTLNKYKKKREEQSYSMQSISCS